MIMKSFNGAEVDIDSNTRNRSFRVEYGLSTYRPNTPPLIIGSDEKEGYIKHVWYWENKCTLVYERIVTYMHLVIYPATTSLEEP
ncbi:hypothetical protein EAE96_011195 [Botrytis aclada]|nr:hypothetical protein EAE96_011195 [Botrytis aclada]